MTREFRGKIHHKAARYLPRWGAGLVLLVAACGCGASTDKPAEKTALGLPPFHLAAREGDLETVREHLESGTDANVRDIDGNTALHRAARDGRLAIAQLLLDFRADPDARTGTGWTSLHLAIRGERTEMVELLLRYGADPNIANPEGAPPLHLAVMKGNESMVRHLLTSRPATEIQKRQKEDGTEEYVRVEKGMREADINAVNSEGRTALHVAISEGNFGMASTLLGYGPDVSKADKEGNLPLHLAAAGGPAHLVQSLIGRGSPVNLRNGAGKTPLDIAYERGDPRVYETIAQRAGN